MLDLLMPTPRFAMMVQLVAFMAAWTTMSHAIRAPAPVYEWIGNYSTGEMVIVTSVAAGILRVRAAHECNRCMVSCICSIVPIHPATPWPPMYVAAAPHQAQSVRASLEPTFPHLTILSIATMCAYAGARGADGSGSTYRLDCRVPACASPTDGGADAHSDTFRKRMDGNAVGCRWACGCRFFVVTHVQHHPHRRHSALCTACPTDPSEFIRMRGGTRWPNHWGNVARLSRLLSSCNTVTAAW